MSTPLVPVITAGGLAALANAQGSGVLATIGSFAIGRGSPSGGGYVGYAPNSTMSALQGPMATIPIVSGSRLDPQGFRVRAILPASSPGEYMIREVGIVLTTGVLFALWSDPVQGLAPKTTLADTEIAFDLLFAQIPTSLLALSVVEPDIPDYVGLLAAQTRTLAVQATNILSINERLIRRGY